MGCYQVGRENEVGCHQVGKEKKVIKLERRLKSEVGCHQVGRENKGRGRFKCHYRWRWWHLDPSSPYQLKKKLIKVGPPLTKLSGSVHASGSSLFAKVPGFTYSDYDGLRADTCFI